MAISLFSPVSQSTRISKEWRDRREKCIIVCTCLQSTDSDFSYAKRSKFQGLMTVVVLVRRGGFLQQHHDYAHFTSTYMTDFRLAKAQEIEDAKNKKKCKKI